MAGDKKNGHVEELLMSPDTIDRIRLMHEMLEQIGPSLKSEIPQMLTMLNSIATATTTISRAATTMAITHEKAEARYARLEERLQEVNDRAAGKGQIPLWSHFIILGGAMLMMVLVVLYVHEQQFDATLTSVSVKGKNNGN